MPDRTATWVLPFGGVLTGGNAGPWIAVDEVRALDVLQRGRSRARRDFVVVDPRRQTLEVTDVERDEPTEARVVDRLALVAVDRELRTWGGLAGRSAAAVAARIDTVDLAGAAGGNASDVVDEPAAGPGGFA